MTQGYRSPQALEAIARGIIKGYDPSLLLTPQAIPVADIMERKYGLRIDYQCIRNNGRVLGETVFDDALVPVYDQDCGGYTLIRVKRGTVLVDVSLIHNCGDGRYRFTLAHELAHWVIDQEKYTGTGQAASMTQKALKSSDEDAVTERQADKLATVLLMPAGQVKMAFHSNRGASEPIAMLAMLFDVSRQAMGIRLRELHLVD